MQSPAQSDVEGVCRGEEVELLRGRKSGGCGHCRLALVMPAQVLKERVPLAGFGDDKHLVHWWRNDSLAALPEVLRMAVG